MLIKMSKQSVAGIIFLREPTKPSKHQRLDTFRAGIKWRLSFL